MRVFVDTEFTDFASPDLISIGLVTENGEEYYAERSDFDLNRCSDFVRKVVLPQLGRKQPRIMTHEELHADLNGWLDRIRERNDHLVVCYDYIVDWTLLSGLIRDERRLSWIDPQDIWESIDELAREQFFMDTGLTDHHALNDAKALRFAFTERYAC